MFDIASAAEVVIQATLAATGDDLSMYLGRWARNSRMPTLVIEALVKIIYPLHQFTKLFIE